MKLPTDLPNKKGIAFGVTALGLVFGLGILRVVFSPNTPSGEGIPADVAATLGFQQGSEKGRQEGIEEGMEAAIMPTIGDAHRSAAIALAESAAASDALIKALICARKGAWLDFASQKAAEGLNPVAVLDEHLRDGAIDPFKELTVEHGQLTATAELMPKLLTPIIENAALVAAIAELRAGSGGRCTIDFTAAYTANTVYIFESRRADAQREDMFQRIDEQLSIEGVAANDESTK